MKTQSLNLLLVFCTCWISRGNGAEAAAGGQSANLVLENQYCRVEVGRQHGVLLRLLDRAVQVDSKSPVELAENFRILVPSPGRAAELCLWEGPAPFPCGGEGGPAGPLWG